MSVKKLDAPFWATLLVGLIAVTSLGCLGFAAAQTPPPDKQILTTDNVPPPADL